MVDEETRKEIERYIEKIEREIAERAVKEILENLDKEELRLIYEFLKHLDYKTIYKIARDYIREIARSGELEKIMESLNEVREPAKEALIEMAKKGIKELSKVRIWEYLPRRFSYYLLALSLFISALILRGVG